MQPFTRADLEKRRDAYAEAKREEYVEDSVEKIYYGARKVAVERSAGAFYYNIREQVYIADVITLAEAIQAKLKVLFPDFTIEIGKVNDGYNGSRYICVKW
jgi:hypothetical protein